jgi:hypothetical protein
MIDINETTLGNVLAEGLYRMEYTLILPVKVVRTSSLP